MADNTYENIKIFSERPETFLTRHRPGKRNAVSPALHYEMEEVTLSYRPGFSPYQREEG